LETALAYKKSNRIIVGGLFANILLAFLKTSVGIIGSSPALLADGINSTSDVVYYVVVSIFMKAASKPADDEHPYGHSQMESIGALVVGAFVITTAVTILWNAIETLVEHFQGDISKSGSSQVALWIALFTVILKIFLTIISFRTAKETNNASILALAQDHRNDIFAALAATIGIALGRFGYLWVDPLAGALVSIFIFRTGIEILRDTTSDLMDTVPGKTLQKQVLNLLNPISQIKRIDKIQAHRFGQYLVINITICVDGQLSVYEGDNIANLVEKTLIDNIPFLLDVHVHFHPEQIKTSQS
jgi:cation diffusion facilitator family transporter